MKRLVCFLLMILCAISSFAQLTGADEIHTTVIHKRPVDDDHLLGNGTNFREFGPTVTRGVGKFFGVKLDYDGSVNREADLRFALYNMNKEIVELYKPMRVHILAGGINGFLIPCKVNAPAGDYYVVPLFRWAGESDWTAVYYSIFHPDNDIDGWYQSLWKFTVIEDRMPLVNYVRIPVGMGYMYQGVKFNLAVKLSNPYSNTINGRLKIMHERNIKKFAPGYTYNTAQSTEEFFDCMSSYASLNGVKAGNDGAFAISVAGKSSLELDFQNIVTYENHGDYDQFAGELVCYFLPDGKSDVPENWIMLQEDCSLLFNGDELVYNEWNSEYSQASTSTESDWCNNRVIVLIPNPTGVPEIVLSEVSVSYNRSSGLLHFSNIPEPCKLVVTSINGAVTQCESSGSDEGVSFNLAALPYGVYIVSLFNYDGNLVKSIKICR